jgi:hypothetical protein
MEYENEVIKITNEIFAKMKSSNGESIDLPKKIETNYLNDLENLYKKYNEILNEYSKELKKLRIKTDTIKNICDNLIESFKKEDYKGIFSEVMNELYKNHFLGAYKKNLEVEECENFYDYLILYRARMFESDKEITEDKIFHPPYELHNSKNSTGRYGRSEEPCLYLGTSIKLCRAEIKPDSEWGGFGCFKINRHPKENRNLEIEILELAIKPSDFLDSSKTISIKERENKGYECRNFDEFRLNSGWARKSYLHWYPLIAACSFASKCTAEEKEEYRLSNYLMDWIIENSGTDKNNKLIGVRYFSCAIDENGGFEPSDWGFNYILPASKPEKPQEHIGYCSKLKRATLFVSCEKRKWEELNSDNAYSLFEKEMSEK